ncbi:MAG: hypothetical protein QNL07_05320 [Candidatus Planktophila sp.]
MKRRRLHVHQEDEATEQAGWLFADSFLALMIIFLATISFVPDIKNQSETEANYVKAMTLTYEQYSAPNIEADISQFLSDEGLSGTTEVVFARIIGGAPAKESDENGYLLALKYSIDLQRDGVQYFRNTRFELGSSKLMADKTVLMQLTFSLKDQ